MLSRPSPSGFGRTPIIKKCPVEQTDHRSHGMGAWGSVHHQGGLEVTDPNHYSLPHCSFRRQVPFRQKLGSRCSRNRCPFRSHW